MNPPEIYFCDVRVWQKQPIGNTVNLSKKEAEQLREELIEKGIRGENVRVRKL